MEGISFMYAKESFSRAVHGGVVSRYLLGLLVLGCSAAPVDMSIEYEVQPISFRVVSEALRPALETGLARWTHATCLPLKVSEDGNVTVQPAKREEIGGRRGWTTGKVYAPLMRIADDMATPLTESVVAHEIWHVLAQRSDHVGEHLAQDFIAPGDLIDTPALEAVCAVADCGCFIPEI